MPALGTHHFCLVVSDLDRTITFYSDLGLVLAKRSRSAADDLGTKLFGSQFGGKQTYAEVDQAVMYLGDTPVEFIQCVSPHSLPYHGDFSRAGSAHIAIHVEDIEAEVARLESGGARFHTPVNIHRDGEFLVKWCYLRDPDDICVELVEGSKF